MEIWLSTLNVSKLLNITIRTVQKNKDKYIFKIEKNNILIALSSLPEESQAKYRGLNIYKETFSDEEDFTKDKKADARLKAHLVNLQETSGKRVKEFLDWYNGTNNTNYTMNQFYSWKKKLKTDGTAALIDKRGGHNKGQSSLPLEAWDYFYSLYMSQQKRGMKLCYDYTKKVYPDIPSFATFRRKVLQIHPYVETYYREGENALRDSLPYMERDKTDINSNDIWFSDHHRVDVFTAGEDGKICRLWLTTFFDARSGKLISYKCRNASPNATIIKECFKTGVETYGIPKEVYFDNGKDYRAKAFCNDYPLSLVHKLGINAIYATPYHGQAKPVERFFRTFEDRFGKMFPTYTGKDAKQRPEQMRTSNDKILTYACSIDDFLHLLDIYIEEYNNAPSKANDMAGKAPNQVYIENLIEKHVIDDFKAFRMLCGTFEKRKVMRNGVSILGRYYEAPELLPYFKKTVIVNYDHNNIDEINVFDEDERFIAVAKVRVRTPYRNTTEEDFKKAQLEKKRIRKMVAEAKPVHNLDTMQLIARNQLLELQRNQKAEENNCTTVKHVLPGIQTTLKTSSIKEKRDEDNNSITKVLLEKYQKEREARQGVK